MTLQQGEQFYADLFGEECCPEQKLNKEEIEESIAECEAMLDYAINDLTNKSEIAFWRKMLQQAKVQRREILTT